MTKPINACARCGKIVHSTVEDPVICGYSLGPGVFHMDCARAQWRERSQAREEYRAEIRAERSKRAALIPRVPRCVACGGPSATGVRECRSCIEARQSREEMES